MMEKPCLNDTQLNTQLSLIKLFHQLKDTHKEKALSDETPALVKSINMGIWVVGTLNELFLRGS